MTKINQKMEALILEIKYLGAIIEKMEGFDKAVKAVNKEIDDQWSKEQKKRKKNDAWLFGEGKPSGSKFHK